MVPACRSCNIGFSRDEEYFACLLQCVLAGSTDPTSIRRASVAKSLRHQTALRYEIENAKTIVDGNIAFLPDCARVNNVLTKLARGHVAFELTREFRRAPDAVSWWPIVAMTPEQREEYEAPHMPRLFGEIGSRGMQRSAIMQIRLGSDGGETVSLSFFFNDWIEVQENVYRYLAFDENDEVRVKIVLEEFLACEISWRSNDTLRGQLASPKSPHGI